MDSVEIDIAKHVKTVKDNCAKKEREQKERLTEKLKTKKK